MTCELVIESMVINLGSLRSLKSLLSPGHTLGIFRNPTCHEPRILESIPRPSPPEMYPMISGNSGKFRTVRITTEAAHFGVGILRCYTPQPTTFEAVMAVYTGFDLVENTRWILWNLEGIRDVVK